MGLKRMMKVACFTMMACLVLSGCSQSDVAHEAQAEGTAVNASADNADEKVLNLALFWLDSNVDPINGWNGWALNRSGIGENLIQIDENMQFKMGIAESYRQLDDCTVEFTIRDNAYFHNGKKVDALACKKSIERALSDSDRMDVKFDVDAITAEGQVLTIKTTKAYPTLLNLLADTVYILVDADAAGESDFAYKPVCTGPFKIIEFDADKGMVLHKHEQYWGAQTNVDVVNVKYIQDGATRTMALQSGEIDIATQINARDLELFKDNDDFVVQQGPNLRVFLLRLNMATPYMSELKFRQALCYGMDKETYATELVSGQAAKGPFNDQLSFGYDGEDMYKYNPDKANALLDELGYMDTDGDGIRECNGENIVIRYMSRTNHGSDANNIGIAMQQQYKEIGLGMVVDQLESYSDRSKAGDFDMMWERWTSAPTSDCQYFIDSGYKTDASGNAGKYSNAALDGIIDQLNVTFDKAERDVLGKEASKILIEDVATLFLYYQEGNVVTNQRVEGVYRYMSEIYYIDDRVMLK
ncbi:MAG: hypothetical protein JXO44_03435 [Clostridia bacterium]|nr:hypothetical protein [Clostridia bacterium]